MNENKLILAIVYICLYGYMYACMYAILEWNMQKFF